MGYLRFITFLVGFSFSLFAYNQEVRWVATDGNQQLLDELVEKLKPNDSASLAANQTQIIRQLQNNGYAEASVDSIHLSTKPATVFVFTGKDYQWVSLSTKSIPEVALRKIGYNEKFYENKPLNIRQLQRLENRLLQYYENHGYPFAQVFLDSLEIGTKLSAHLKVKQNGLVIIDSVTIHSEATLPESYLHNYIGIKPGDLYNEKLIREVPTRLKEIPFVKQTRPPATAFTDEETILNLFVEKQKASSFNGIVGFLPDEATGDILITGDVKLVLQNGLNAGELIRLNWRRLETNTQDLQVQAHYPFIGATPLGGEANVKLYRKDTTFAEQNIRLGLQYALSRGNFFRVFWEGYSSNLISTQQYEGSLSLPANADMRKRLYGVGLTAFKLNYKFNPRSGYTFDINFSSGNKQILQNPNLDATLYDSVEVSTNQFFLAGNGQFFIPLFKQSTIMVGGQGGWLINDQLFANELFRIGGLQTLRGFDEESILASAYGILTAEYRILLEENSYFFVFADGAFWEADLPNSYDRDTPIGFGTGISFETKAGIFTLNYALGRQRNNPIDLRTNKIHFGFVSLF